MDLKKVPVGKNAPYDVNVIIEIPMGGNPVKYELDKASGAIFVDRFLHTAMYYPFNYGFIPHTLSEDGDQDDAGPLDLLRLQLCVVPRGSDFELDLVDRCEPLTATLIEEVVLVKCHWFALLS